MRTRAERKGMLVRVNESRDPTQVAPSIAPVCRSAKVRGAKRIKRIVVGWVNCQAEIIFTIKRQLSWQLRPGKTAVVALENYTRTARFHGHKNIQV